MADIVSPLPGIFYRRPGPGKPVFVEEGVSVEIGQAIGMVEIMKQFTEISASAAGVVGSFLVEDGGMVNPGDVIVTVDEN
ncbi:MULTISPECIES: acetyl-CoA carboxylase [Microbacterium]|uniref:acetyl-CoA carboxylase n=1 Tax=Microbacterium TaxID=33882 RepID=UPI000CFC46AA|nr:MULTISPECIES: acetyl-CoA carboxylase [unclassified Microbacterium]PRB04743.1 acetyl-CoA carboxylase biotin carboxyl carrier protein subunit [Microbacterium sp. MYb72]